MNRVPGMATSPPNAPTEYREHPGDSHLVGCPNCHATDQLVIDVPMVMHHKVEVWAIDGITEPEFDVIDSDEIDPRAPIEKIDKVRCLACKWAFTGQQPLTKLVPV